MTFSNSALERGFQEWKRNGKKEIPEEDKKKTMNAYRKEKIEKIKSRRLTGYRNEN